MKKLATILLTIIMVLSVSISVFAAQGAFVESPGKNKAPEVIESEEEIYVIPFDQRDKLSKVGKEEFEYAYEKIIENSDITDTVEGLEEVAEDLGIVPDGLGVSDIFFVDGEDGEQDIVLKLEDVYNFVSLIVYKDSKWQIVEGAKIVGKNLVFTGEASYPYAIVVDTGSKLSQTGDTSNIWIYVVVMTVSAVALVIFWNKSRNQED